MGKLARNVVVARTRRNSVRNDFDTRLMQVRTDLEARGVGGRIADRVSEEARETFDEAVDVAAESKTIIAGTIAALVLWFMRNPIMAMLENLVGTEDDDPEEDSDHD